MKKTILITGITGMVGSHLADYIIENTEWNIVGLIRWRSSLENIAHLIHTVNNEGRVKLEYGDLNDPISLEKVVKKNRPEIIFHLAAQSYPKTSFDAPLDTLNTNIQGTLCLLEAAKNHAKDAIIHVCASSEIFGRVTPDKLPITEDCTFHPASPYAISKVGTDLIGRFYAEAYGLKVITTRMFTHTGPRRGDVFAESSFAKQIALIEAGYVPPTIYVGNLQSLRTIADVRDAVRAYYLLVTCNPIAGQYYNIGGDFSIEIGGILEFLIKSSTKQAQISVEVSENRLRPIDADLQVPDTTKFREHTGRKPEIPFETTMIDLLDYWRDKVAAHGNSFLNR